MIQLQHSKLGEKFKLSGYDEYFKIQELVYPFFLIKGLLSKQILFCPIHNNILGVNNYCENDCEYIRVIESTFKTSIELLMEWIKNRLHPKNILNNAT